MDFEQIQQLIFDIDGDDESEEEYVASTSSSSGDTDEEAIQFGQIAAGLPAAADRRARVTIQNYVQHTVQNYDDVTFIMHFRLRRELVNQLIEQFSASEFFLEAGNVPEGGGRPQVAADRQLLLYLWLLGHEGSCYRDLADRFDVSLSTMFAIITRVGNFVMSLAPNVIRWPSEEEQNMTMAYYLEHRRFPGIIGSVDGTQIRTDKPFNNGDAHINRHGYPAIQTQICSNHKRKIFHVFTGFPGSTHDARVFDNSNVQDKHIVAGGHLIGDSAYTLTPRMMTPFRDNGFLTPAKKNYNKIHSRCRIGVEHTIGLLKNRFRILTHLKLRNRRRQLTTIIACCVLHNLANEEDLALIGEMPEIPEAGNEDDIAAPAEPAAETGIQVRDGIAANLPRVFH